MFGSEKNIESMKKLFLEFKKYLELQRKFFMWGVGEKLTVLLATLAISVVVIILAALTLLFLTFALAYYIGNITDNLPLGFVCVGGVLVLTLIVFYALRSKLIIQPLAKFIIELFLEKQDKDDRKQ